MLQLWQCVHGPLEPGFVQGMQRNLKASTESKSKWSILLGVQKTGMETEMWTVKLFSEGSNNAIRNWDRGNSYFGKNLVVLPNFWMFKLDSIQRKCQLEKIQDSLTSKPLCIYSVLRARASRNAWNIVQFGEEMSMKKLTDSEEGAVIIKEICPIREKNHHYDLSQ